MNRASPHSTDPLDEIGAGLRAIVEAGADELILVLDPITEASIRRSSGPRGVTADELQRGAIVARRAPARTGDHDASGTTRRTRGVERCTEHACCFRAPGVVAAPGFAHLAGEWHLEWMSNDSAWFLVPPQATSERSACAGEPTHPASSRSTERSSTASGKKSP